MLNNSFKVEKELNVWRKKLTNVPIPYRYTYRSVNSHSYKKVYSNNPTGKINLNKQIYFPSHRSGWGYAFNALKNLHNKRGVFLDSFIEDNFIWKETQNRRVYNFPWIGFVHNPFEIPDWYPMNHHLLLFQDDIFTKSLNQCRGFFCLSQHHANYMNRKTGMPTCSLIHPTEIPEKIFSIEDFLANKNKKIVNVGSWLRKLHSIFRLPLYRNEYEKVVLWPASVTFMDALKELWKEEYVNTNVKHIPEFYYNTRILKHLSNDHYDDMLSKNIMFVDLFDTSANNAVVECIARGTPILINRLPAITEYLGKDYPLFFDSLGEAAEKVKNFELVIKAHHYLMKCPTRKKLSGKYFKTSFENSKIYKSL